MRSGGCRRRGVGTVSNDWMSDWCETGAVATHNHRDYLSNKCGRKKTGAIKRRRRCIWMQDVFDVAKSR